MTIERALGDQLLPGGREPCRTHPSTTGHRPAAGARGRQLLSAFGAVIRPFGPLPRMRLGRVAEPSPDPDGGSPHGDMVAHAGSHVGSGGPPSTFACGNPDCRTSSPRTSEDAYPVIRSDRARACLALTWRSSMTARTFNMNANSRQSKYLPLFGARAPMLQAGQMQRRSRTATVRTSGTRLRAVLDANSTTARQHGCRRSGTGRGAPRRCPSTAAAGPHRDDPIRTGEGAPAASPLEMLAA